MALQFGIPIAGIKGERSTNDRHYTFDNSDPGAVGGTAHMGIQQWMGILSKRRPGTGVIDRYHPAANWPPLSALCERSAIVLRFD
jgi:hypothetical protein